MDACPTVLTGHAGTLGPPRTTSQFYSALFLSGASPHTPVFSELTFQGWGQAGMQQIQVRSSLGTSESHRGRGCILGVQGDFLEQPDWELALDDWGGVEVDSGILCLSVT